MITHQKDMEAVEFGPGIIDRTPNHDSAVMSVLEATFDAGVEITPHSHAVHQMHYLIKGKMRLIQGGEVSILNAGDYYYTPAGVEHKLEIIEKTVKFSVSVPDHSHGHDQDHDHHN